MAESNIGKVTIYLVRHAQTEGNVCMKIAEAEEGILTNLGRIQANLLGLHLSSTKFDHVYSSDYARAIQTTENVLKLSAFTSSIPITPCEQLREVNFGESENSSYEEIFEYCKSLNKSVFEWDFPGGESFPEAGQRMLKFIKETCLELIEKYKGKDSPTILMVSHSAAIAFFLHTLSKAEENVEVIGMENHELKLMRNACYMQFEVETGPSNNNGNNDENGADADESSPPPSSPKLTFRFLEKYYSKHLNCIAKLGSSNKANNPLLKFAMTSSSASKEFVDCVQQ